MHNESRPTFATLFTTALAAATLAGFAPAQVVREAWRQSLRTSRLSIDRQNHVYLDHKGPLNDFYARKLDPRGNELWAQSFGDPNVVEVSHWLAVDSRGNVMVTGHRHGAAGGMLTVKFGTDGAVLWWDLFQGGSPTEGYRVEVDAADNIYVAGRYFDPIGRNDFLTVKYDPSGNVLWSRQRDFFGNDDGADALAVTPSGTVAVTGHSSHDLATVVYDTNGRERFHDWRLAAAGGQDVGFGPDGSVYVCSGDAASSAALLVALSPTGTPAWTVRHIGPNGPFAWGRRLAVDSAGNVVVIGHADSMTAYMDWLVFKVDPTGTVLWSHTHDGYSGNDEFATAVAIGPDDAIHVTGTAGSTCGGLPGLGQVTIRYDAGGAIDWIHQPPCTSGDARTIALDSFGDILVGGVVTTLTRSEESRWAYLGEALSGTNGAPALDVRGHLDPRGQVSLAVTAARPQAFGVHVFGTGRADLPIAGGTLVPIALITVPFAADGFGRSAFSFSLPSFVPIATELYVQSWLLDPGSAGGLAATNAVVKALQ